MICNITSFDVTPKGSLPCVRNSPSIAVIFPEMKYKIKYLLLILIGMVIGSFLYLFVDDFFSNNQLNEWAWKVAYILLLFDHKDLHIFSF